ncbi:response regulator transcription factor [Planctobacterium marinum]|uniref:response regulator transcription factor n=1 Tax=Planctobacterium marinum TaxID=1631968 RepID=UPI001E374B2B|nr:response regulator transcription factor [Planctobacterium marinum]MCC2605449.1 response regulator transcription factor [Planctobacterium marinum]
MADSIKIIIAEDQAMLLGAVATLLDLESDFEVVAKAKDGETALSLCAQHHPDVLLTDIEMPGMSGIELAEQLQKNGFTAKIMILTTFARSGYLRRAMDAGVRGYLLKDAPSEELAEAIRKVISGRKVIDPELVMEAFDEADPLSEKERKTLKLAADGLTTEQIADKLFLSKGTVRNYLSSASAKLNAQNRIEAARIARQRGWL